MLFVFYAYWFYRCRECYWTFYCNWFLFVWCKFSIFPIKHGSFELNFIQNDIIFGRLQILIHVILGHYNQTQHQHFVWICERALANCYDLVGQYQFISLCVSDSSLLSLERTYMCLRAKHRIYCDEANDFANSSAKSYLGHI